MTNRFGEDYDIRSICSSIKIKDVMSRSIVTVTENDEISSVEEIFLRWGLSHVCVVNEDKKMVGLISQKYLYKTRSPQKILPGKAVQADNETIVDGDSFYDKETLDSYLLTDIMDKNASTLHEEDSIGKAISYMARLKISCIPIVDDEQKVCGIINERDIIKLVAELIS